MSINENISLLKNLGVMLKICNKKEDKHRCIEMMKDTFDILQQVCTCNDSKLPDDKTKFYSMPAPLLLKIIKRSLEPSVVIKKVHIVAPEVTPERKKKRSHLETSTRFQRGTTETETETETEKESYVMYGSTDNTEEIQDVTESETAVFTFMDKYGNKIASFFNDM